MNASKQKGTAAETAIVNYLKVNGFPNVERRALSGNKDRGDIAGIPGVVIEVKNVSRTNLAGWLDEAVIEAANDGADVAAVIFKRRGTTDPGQWYGLVNGATLVRLLRASGHGSPE